VPTKGKAWERRAKRRRGKGRESREGKGKEGGVGGLLLKDGDGKGRKRKNEGWEMREEREWRGGRTKKGRSLPYQ